MDASIFDKEQEQLDEFGNPIAYATPMLIPPTTPQEDILKQSLPDRGDSLMGTPPTTPQEDLLVQSLPDRGDTLPNPLEYGLKPLEGAPAEADQLVKDPLVREHLIKKAAAAKAAEPTTEAPSSKTYAETAREAIKAQYGMPKDLGDEALQAAQGSARNKELIADVMSGVDTAVAGMTGSKEQTDFYNKMRERAQRPVEQLSQRRAAKAQEQDQIGKGIQTEKALGEYSTQQAMDSADSAMSEHYRNTYGRIYPNSKKDPKFNTLTATEITELSKMDNSEEGRQLRLEIAEQNRQGRVAATKEKHETTGEKNAVALGDALDPNNKRNTQSRLLKAQSDQLAHVIRLGADPNYMYSLTEAESLELSQGLARAVAAGVGGVGKFQVEHLMPKSAMGSGQDMLSWIKNEPRGRNQQEFIKRMLHNSEAQKELYDNQLKLAQVQAAARFEKGVREENPEAWERELNVHGLDSETYDAYKEYGKKTAKEGKPLSPYFFRDFQKQRGGAVAPQASAPAEALSDEQKTARIAELKEKQRQARIAELKAKQGGE